MSRISAELSQSDICDRLHRMVDELAKMPAAIFGLGLPQIRITMENDSGEAYVLVVGLERAGPDDRL